MTLDEKYETLIAWMPTMQNQVNELAAKLRELQGIGETRADVLMQKMRDVKLESDIGLYRLEERLDELEFQSQQSAMPAEELTQAVDVRAELERLRAIQDAQSARINRLYDLLHFGWKSSKMRRVLKLVQQSTKRTII